MTRIRATVKPLALLIGSLLALLTMGTAHSQTNDEGRSTLAMIKFGGGYTERISQGRWGTVKPNPSFSLGVALNIPVGKRPYLAACLDWQDIDRFSGFLVWSVEVDIATGLRLRGMQFQPGIGYGKGTLMNKVDVYDSYHGCYKFIVRLVNAPSDKLGFLLESVLWVINVGSMDKTASSRFEPVEIDPLITFRVGMVF